jgi:endonuclease/exonuclease/phosphatase family metal-dependent hydrolase
MSAPSVPAATRATTVPASPPATLVVANFNVHAGIDGWGRPFDVVAACRDIDADVLVLQECWTPSDGQPGMAAGVGDALGYEVHELSLSTGRRAGPHPKADARWMRPFDWRGASHAIYLDEHRPLGPGVARSARFRQAATGRWGIAVLSRLPVLDHQVLDLGRLRRDRARRGALAVQVAVGGRRLAVVGTHMTHLSYGSPLHFARLRRLVGPVVGDDPAVLSGDMNLWGPPVSALLSGWRRAVRGRTWPAWNPHSQVDHILVRGPVEVLGGEVLPMAGSDHRPVRVRLALP